MGDTAKIFNEAEDSRTRDYVQGKFDIAFGIAAVLLALTLALNLLASLTAGKARKER